MKVPDALYIPIALPLLFYLLNLIDHICLHMASCEYHNFGYHADWIPRERSGNPWANIAANVPAPAGPMFPWTHLRPPRTPHPPRRLWLIPHGLLPFTDSNMVPSPCLPLCLTPYFAAAPFRRTCSSLLIPIYLSIFTA